MTLYCLYTKRDIHFYHAFSFALYFFSTGVSWFFRIYLYVHDELKPAVYILNGRSFTYITYPLEFSWSLKTNWKIWSFLSVYNFLVFFSTKMTFKKRMTSKSQALISGVQENCLEQSGNFDIILSVRRCIVVQCLFTTIEPSLDWLVLTKLLN